MGLRVLMTRVELKRPAQGVLSRLPMAQVVERHRIVDVGFRELDRILVDQAVSQIGCLGPLAIGKSNRSSVLKLRTLLPGQTSSTSARSGSAPWPSMASRSETRPKAPLKSARGKRDVSGAGVGFTSSPTGGASGRPKRRRELRILGEQQQHGQQDHCGLWRGRDRADSLASADSVVLKEAPKPSVCL